MIRGASAWQKARSDYEQATRQRDCAITRAVARGVPVARIAVDFGLTRIRIYQIAEKQRGRVS
jgi:hypothetical protein